MKTKAMFSLALLFGVSTSKASELTVVDKPATTSQNSYYQGNRAPLTPSPLIKLPVGSVEPQGWLRENIQRQHKGLSGSLGEISAWLQKEDNAWLSKDGKGKWGWEELPYWLKGYANTAYMVNDKKAIQEATFWIKGAMNGQRENGDFGPIHFSPKRFGGGRDFWGNMIMLYCMQSYYEYSGDKQVLDVMGKYFKYQLSVPDNKFLVGYWQKLRGGDNLHSVLWYYNETGDEFALELAKKIHKHTANWSSRGHGRKGVMGRQHKRHDMKEWPKFWGDLVDWHNVNLAQCFREPATFYQLSGDKKDLQATYDVFNIIRDNFGQVPGGMYGGDENCRPGYNDPRQATETCALVEQMNSNQHLLRITGDTFWADHCEEVAFNMYPAATTADFKAIRYLTAPNMTVSDTRNHAPGIDNGGPFLAMNPFSSRCCQHNHAQGWPYFAENLWMATPDNGLAAVVYSASDVKAKVGNGQAVKIKQLGNYPFEDKITFKFSANSDVEFPLYLRIPKWSKNGFVTINGEKQDVTLTAGKFLRIDRKWENGDVVVLNLPMTVNTKRYEKNHNAMSVHYGPLTFSLKIKEDYKSFPSNTKTIFDSKWRKDVDITKWPAYEIFSNSAWNYGLDLIKGSAADFKVEKKAWPTDNYPFTTDSAPIRIKTTARRIPQWQAEKSGLCGELQDSPVKSSEQLETVELIPMGAARLRISAFPVIGHGKDAVEWVDSKQPLYGPKASHVFESDKIEALSDKIIPASSSDTSVPRHTFWPHKGSKEWLEYSFRSPKEIKNVGLYWFDDTDSGLCRVPKSWQLFYKDGSDWKAAETTSPYTTKTDQFNVIKLKQPIKTKGLRISLKLQNGFSGGVLEWAINKPEKKQSKDPNQELIRLKNKAKKELSSQIKEFNSYKGRPKSDGFINKSNVEPFLVKNIPYFLSSEQKFTKTYNYRWWMMMKHLREHQDKETKEKYYVFTEFFGHKGWASRSWAITCPAGHQFYDLRWMRDPKYLKSYAEYYMGGPASKLNQRVNANFLTWKDRPESHHYSSWMIDGTEALLKIHPNKEWRDMMLPRMAHHQKVWSELFTVKNPKSKTDGMYKILDLYDGMEFAISAVMSLIESDGAFEEIKENNWKKYYLGWGACRNFAKSEGAKKYPKASRGGYPNLYLVRPSVNSYFYGNNVSLAKLYAQKAKENKDQEALKLSKKYKNAALTIRNKTMKVLWNEEDQFFNTISAGDNEYGVKDYEARVRESVGFTPWYFNMVPKPERKFDKAWEMLDSDKGFKNTKGATTAERQSPYYNEHAYAWNGRGWPLSNSILYKSFANYLKNYKTEVTAADKKLLYKNIEQITDLHGKQPNIGEWYIPSNGRGFGGCKDYFHSSYPDMIIEDLLGFTSSHDSEFSLNPLLPEEKWDFFYLGNLRYHNRDIDIIWKKDWDSDKEGNQSELCVWVNGKLKATSKSLNEKLNIKL